MSVAITIKTYRRPERVVDCVRSIETYCDVPFRLYIADDSPSGLRPLELYRDLGRRGHYVHIFEEHVSVTSARNVLLGQLQKENYVLRLDDDFLFGPQTSLTAMINVLEACPHIGAVASVERQLGRGKGKEDGELSDKQGFLLRDSGALRKLEIPLELVNWRATPDGVRFAPFDFTRNFLLIKRKVFNNVRWREELFFESEHLGFMHDLFANNWGLAQTPDSVHLHDCRGQDSELYARARQGSGPGTVQGGSTFARIFGGVKGSAISFRRLYSLESFIKSFWGKLFLFVRRKLQFFSKVSRPNGRAGG